MVTLIGVLAIYLCLTATSAMAQGLTVEDALPDLGARTEPSNIYLKFGLTGSYGHESFETDEALNDGNLSLRFFQRRIFGSSWLIWNADLDAHLKTYERVQPMPLLGNGVVDFRPLGLGYFNSALSAFGKNTKLGIAANFGGAYASSFDTTVDDYGFSWGAWADWEIPFVWTLDLNLNHRGISFHGDEENFLYQTEVMAKLYPISNLYFGFGYNGQSFKYRAEDVTEHYGRGVVGLDFRPISVEVFYNEDFKPQSLLGTNYGVKFMYTFIDF